MSYRNKTYIAFASEDLNYYWLMKAWNENEKIDFDFFNAHDVFEARDSSSPETIKRRLRERLNNTKQVILLGSKDARRKGGDGDSFLAYEIEVILELNLPIVIANLCRSRNIVTTNIPQPLIEQNHFNVSVSFQPKIIQYALDNYAEGYAESESQGTHRYVQRIYEELGL
jgi:hypothetical protein